MKRNLFILSLLFVSIMTVAQTTYIVTAQSLRVRKAPSTEAAVLGALSSGQEIQVEQIVNGWAKFQYKGQTAYTSSKYLVEKVIETAQNEPEGYVSTSTIIADENSDTYRSQTVQSNQNSIQYFVFQKPKLEFTGEMAMMDFPVGKIYELYNNFNFGQHYSLGAKVFFTPNLYTSVSLEWQWFLLSRYESSGQGTYYRSTSVDVFRNFVGVPIRIGYGGGYGSLHHSVDGRHQFGISVGFWLGGDVGGFAKVEDHKSKTKTKTKDKGGDFVWAPMVSVCWSFVNFQYRAYLTKKSDLITHTIGLSFSF